MSATSSIEWTDKTWNPVRGCSIVSPGCVNCYAMRQGHRQSGEGKAYHGLTRLTKAGPQWTGVVRTVDAALLEPLSWRKPQRVFVNSMSDLFHDDVPDEFLLMVFAVMASTDHQYQVLTKRAARMREFVTRLRWMYGFGVVEIAGRNSILARLPYLVDGLNPWSRIGRVSDPVGPRETNGIPRFVAPNVWLGVSVEDQPRYDERIGDILRTPAAVRFLSYEPALGPLDLRLGGNSLPEYSAHDPLPQPDWLIVGGESGSGARHFDLAWARSIVQQCKAAGVPVFVKQLGSMPMAGRMPHPDDMFIRLQDRKGGDPLEWPIDLRVREFPEVRG